MSELIIRCPRLGGEVTFAYCLVEGGALPCPRVLLCWQPYFPVEKFLRERLTHQQWDRWCNHRPKDKMSTLIDLVKEAEKGGEDMA